MANEIRTRYSSTGATIYRQVVRASDGYIYNGTSFAAVPTAASWGDYSSALSEQSTTQYYYGDFPAVSAGLYNVYLYLQSGGSPATTDTLLEVQTIRWEGSAEQATPTTAEIGAAQVSFYLDEGGNNLIFRVCYTDGTTYKSGTVALV